jgi:hypothetical protein
MVISSAYRRRRLVAQNPPVRAAARAHTAAPSGLQEPALGQKWCAPHFWPSGHSAKNKEAGDDPPRTAGRASGEWRSPSALQREPLRTTTSKYSE